LKVTPLLDAESGTLDALAPMAASRNPRIAPLLAARSGRKWSPCPLVALTELSRQSGLPQLPKLNRSRIRSRRWTWELI
jgi:hypothetical protein